MEIGKWKILDSKYIIKRPWLTARVDKVELPNGVVNPEYYVLEYPTWVNVIAITAEGKFVMVEQYRHGLANVLRNLLPAWLRKEKLRSMPHSVNFSRRPDMEMAIGNSSLSSRPIREQ